MGTLQRRNNQRSTSEREITLRLAGESYFGTKSDDSMLLNSVEMPRGDWESPAASLGWGHLDNECNFYTTIST